MQLLGASAGVGVGAGVEGGGHRGSSWVTPTMDKGVLPADRPKATARFQHWAATSAE